MKNNEVEKILCLMASAGSGKTYSLAKRYVQLLLNGAEVNNILALTFTNKAASEMKERIAKFILKDLRDKNSNFYKDLTENNQNQKVVLQIEKKLDQITYDFTTKTKRIKTLDAFFHELFNRFKWYLGFKNMPNITNDIKNFKEFDNIFLEEFIRALKKQNLEEKFITSFEGIMDYKEYFELVKKHKIKKENLKPKNLDPKTELEKIRSLIDKIEPKLNKNGKPNSKNTRTKLKEIFSLDNLEEIKKGINKFMTGQKLKTAKTKEESEFTNKYFVEALKLFFDLLDDRLLVVLQNTIDIAIAYQLATDRALKEINTIDHDEISNNAFALLHQNKELRDYLYFMLDNCISHILLDEFQDTSRKQYEILLPLLEEIFAGIGQRGDNRSLFYVGDIKQSIYKFRGGDYTLFEALNQKSKPYNGVIEELPYNYRSSREVVDFNNVIFSKIYSNMKKIKFDYKDQKLPNNNKNQGGIIITKPLILDKNTEKDESSTTIKITTAYDGIIASINDLLSAGIRPNDIAILCKSNALCEITFNLLRRIKDLKINIKRNSKLQQTRSFVIIKSALKLKELAERYKANQNCGVKIGQMKFLEAIINKQMGATGEENLKDLKIILSKKSPINVITAEIMKHLKLFDDNAIATFMLIRDSNTLKEALEILERCDSEVSSDGSGINIMTIHKSKGLQFKVVLVLNYKETNAKAPKVMIEGDKIYDTSPLNLLRTRAQIFNSDIYEDLEEAKLIDDINLLYVALTRAEEQLILINCYKASKNDEGKQKDIKDTKDIFQYIINNAPAMTETNGNYHIGAIITKSLLLDEVANNCNIAQEKSSKNLEYIAENIPAADRQNDINKESEGNFADDRHAAEIGNCFHKAMELHFAHNTNDEIIKHNLKNSYGYYLGDEMLDNIIKTKNEVLKNKEFINLISKSKNRAEVNIKKEDFGTSRIDLLSIEGKRAIIFDFKTGDHRKGIHTNQLKEYAKILENQFDIIEKYLIYVVPENQRVQTIKVD